MFPPEGREVFENLGIDVLPVAGEGLNGALDIDGVPKHDGRCDEGETAGPVALLFEAAIPDLPEAAEEHCSCECIAGLAFVETGMNAASEVDALEPGEDEERSFDTSEFSQSHGETILARIASELAEHERSRHCALFDRSGESQYFVPVGAYGFEVDGAAGHGFEGLVLDLAGWQVQFGVAQVTDPGSKAEAEQMHERKDMIGEAGRVGVMLFDPQIGFMVKQASAQETEIYVR